MEADIHSIALTALSSLLRKYGIDPQSIGHLEVGTETILDKSKSVKTVLMQLFPNNSDIEGTDTLNACYGGTSALFNAVNWVESSSWDGRDAIVVAGDIAIYSKGAARPTGGAGCVAMLVGANAPLVFESGLRASYMKHAYDFYKPDLTSEYPVVDGKFSIKCYNEAVDACYKAYMAKKTAQAHTHLNDFASDQPNGAHEMASNISNGINGATTNGTNGVRKATPTGLDGVDSDVTNGSQDLDDAKLNLANSTGPQADEDNSTPLDYFDYMCFHTPTCKIVAKSFARLLYNDYLVDAKAPAFSSVELPPSSDPRHEKAVADTFSRLSKKKFAARVQPSLLAAGLCGNMYCASLYGGLCSLVSAVSLAPGKKIGMFSYGSGLLSSLFSLRVKGETAYIAQALNLAGRLGERQVVSAEIFEEVRQIRRTDLVLSFWQLNSSQ